MNSNPSVLDGGEWSASQLLERNIPAVNLTMVVQPVSSYFIDCPSHSLITFKIKDM
jgi:hypothetical protein